MNSKHKWLLAAGIVACGLGIYLLSNDDSVKNNRKLKKSNVLEILEDLKRELVPIFVRLSSFSLSLRERIGDKLPDQDIRQLLMLKTPIPSEIQKAELKIYEKHSISQAEFQSICESDFPEDPEIQEILLSMKKMIEDAYLGKHPEIKMDLPEFISSSFMLDLLKELYDVTKFTTLNKLLTLKQSGIQLDENSAEFRKVTHDLENETQSYKDKVYENYGLANQKESPNLIMHVALQKYKSDPSFCQKLLEIEQDFSQAMNLITSFSVPELEIKRLYDKYSPEPLIQELSEPRVVEQEEVYEKVKFK